VNRLPTGFTADTQVHADFVSGNRELAGLGARLLAPRTIRLSRSPHQELRGGLDWTWAGSRCGRWPPRDTPPNTPAPAARPHHAGGGKSPALR
jgi:hypothetical protein